MTDNSTNETVWEEVTESRLSASWVTNEYISISLVSIFVPIILCSNVMVVTSVIKFKRLHIPTNYFITSLALADIVIALALPFYVTVELTPMRVSDDAACLAANRVLMTAGGVSILTLAIIAYDRYTAITYPLEYIMLMTKRKILILVVLSWVFSGVVCWIPIIFGWHSSVSQHASLCSNSVLDKKSRILFICAIFTPSCTSILYFYCKIFRIARHHANAIADMENSLRHSLEMKFVKSDTKYAKTIAVVIGVFLFLWLPYQICLLLNFVGYNTQSHWVNNYLMLLAFLNSGVNPWIYAYQNADFKTAFKLISDSWKCKGSLGLDDRRSSIISTVSVLPGTSSTGRLNRTNSRVLASDILYTLSQQVGRDRVEDALNRRLSATYSVVNAVHSLPDLLKLYANTYRRDSLVDTCIVEECGLESETDTFITVISRKSDTESKDSTCPMSEITTFTSGSERLS